MSSGKSCGLEERQWGRREGVCFTLGSSEHGWWVGWRKRKGGRVHGFRVRTLVLGALLPGRHGDA